jgi:hypothetical protein
MCVIASGRHSICLCVLTDSFSSTSAPKHSSSRPNGPVREAEAEKRRVWTTGSQDSPQQQPGWSPGHKILNDTGAREREHTFAEPVPIVARIVWADDGEEHIETVAADL